MVSGPPCLWMRIAFMEERIAGNLEIGRILYDLRFHARFFQLPAAVPPSPVTDRSRAAEFHRSLRSHGGMAGPGLRARRARIRSRKRTVHAAHSETIKQGLPVPRDRAKRQL